MRPQASDTKPWYRQFWPWFLMALPATVVVASISMLFVALKNDDSAVRDDYYKAGLAINQDLAAEQRAVALGLRGTLAIDTGTGDVRLTLAQQDADAIWPDALRLEVLHPLDNDADFELLLQRVAPGSYRADLARPIAGRWHLQLHPTDHDWRLRETIDLRADSDAAQQWPIAP